MTKLMKEFSHIIRDKVQSKSMDSKLWSRLYSFNGRSKYHKTLFSWFAKDHLGRIMKWNS